MFFSHQYKTCAVRIKLVVIMKKILKYLAIMPVFALIGCEAATNITLQPGTSLTTGDGFVPSTVDNYTVKVHLNSNKGKTQTTINGVPYETQGMDLYFLAE